MKINLDENEQNALATFNNSGQNAIQVMKKIFTFYIEDLESVKNIDPKGNMGLQSLARQEALKIVEEMRDIIFPDLAGPAQRVPAEQKISQYR